METRRGSHGNKNSRIFKRRRQTSYKRMESDGEDVSRWILKLFKTEQKND